MADTQTFNQAKAKHLKTLNQYVPIVSKVHGKSHPEFYEVDRLFVELTGIIKKAGSNIPRISEEFLKLREVTNNYTVPDDVCESYEAVYDMLSELDKAYHRSIDIAE